MWCLKVKETGPHDVDWALQLHLLILLKGVFFSFVAGDGGKQITFHVVSHSEVKGEKITSHDNVSSQYCFSLQNHKQNRETSL